MVYNKNASLLIKNLYKTPQIKKRSISAPIFRVFLHNYNGKTFFTKFTNFETILFSEEPANEQ